MISQRNDRIDTRGACCREVARSEGIQQEQNRHTGECQSFVRLHAISQDDIRRPAMKAPAVPIPMPNTATILC